MRKEAVRKEAVREEAARKVALREEEETKEVAARAVTNEAVWEEEAREDAAREEEEAREVAVAEREDAESKAGRSLNPRVTLARFHVGWPCFDELSR